MQGRTLGREEFYNRILNLILNLLDAKVLGVIVFGSRVYMGEGNDIDLLVILDDELKLKEKIRLEAFIASKLRRTFKGATFDVHVFDVQGFQENLVPGSFLSGLALGYQVLYERGGVEEKIINFLKNLSKERCTLHNKYGTWNLGFHALILLKRKGFQ
ncbi:MAG: hypothetical protein DRJ41_01785 [Thermoprotei archaeon]|nr:MAG: hypothetical protein DRJ41_01785 [Thermoprotei archaeon]